MKIWGMNSDGTYNGIQRKKKNTPGEYQKEAYQHNIGT